MSLADKKFQKLSREEMKAGLLVAQGTAESDCTIMNIKILDLVTGKLYPSAIAISGKYIAGVGLEYEKFQSKKMIDGKGAVVVPGFIDGHVHIESCMMTPFEFEAMTLPLGTTTAICDPHEITNVMGEEGFEWFLRSAELMEQNFYVQVSSCVPALPGFETNGSEFNVSAMKKFKESPHVLGLAEMMNFPGVIYGDENVHDKIEAFQDLNLDGHAPLLRGTGLNAYIFAGIKNCHETVLLEEGEEKLQKGMSVMLREGSVAKNLLNLSPLVTEFSSSQCFLCTDDRNPFEISHEGHINFMVKELIQKAKIPPHVAYRLSSFSAAKHFGLKRMGLVAPGMKADLVLLKDYLNVDIQDVFINGKIVNQKALEEKSSDKLQKSKPPIRNTINREKISTDELTLQLEIGTYNVIEVVPNEIITHHLKLKYDGQKFETDDVLFMANVERYGKKLKPALGLVKGFQLKSGAIASSVAHDSHNLMCVGTNVEDMALALNTIRESGGGFVVVDQGKVLALVKLPIAGLMSLDSHHEISSGIEKLKTAFKSLGISLNEPFIQLAFLALPVIPTLKLTDRGLVDVSTFKFISLKSE